MGMKIVYLSAGINGLSHLFDMWCIELPLPPEMEDNSMLFINGFIV